MNVTWIIGNGYDLNLGLRTGYPDFYHRCYKQLEDAEAVAHRERLDTLITDLGESPELWSDFELLLGKSTVGFDNPDEHHECFQRMKQEMESYLLEQQGRFDASSQLREFYDEFAASLTAFPERLDSAERDAIESRFEESWVNRVEVVTLNYTNCIEACIDAMKNRPIEGGIFTARSHIVDSVIHAHGSLEEPRQVVFAVASAEQAANISYRFDEEFRQCWTKPGLDDVYGNGRLRDALTAIEQADVIASFGCSFGPTDEHIWKSVGAWMRRSSNACFVSFEYGLLEKGEDVRAYLRQSSALKERLVSKFGMGLDSSVLDRITTVPASRVFRFTGDCLAMLGKDPSNDDARAVNRAIPGVSGLMATSAISGLEAARLHELEAAESREKEAAELREKEAAEARERAALEQRERRALAAIEVERAALG